MRPHYKLWGGPPGRPGRTREEPDQGVRRGRERPPHTCFVAQALLPAAPRLISASTRHSYLSATIGSTRVARRDGTYAAAIAIPHNTPAAAPYTHASHGFSPY